jgi:hypothetical protein
MKTTLTINDDLWWKFQEEIARRRKTQKDAIEEALANYISSGQVKPPPDRHTAQPEKKTGTR